MHEKTPERDAPTEPTAQEEAEEPSQLEEEEESEAEEEAKPRKDWKENFHVIQMEEIETVDRLKIVTGVNEYKGVHVVFLAKVTDKNFSRQFFSMPAWVWNKALPIVQKQAASIAEVEKAAMIKAVTAELKRLQELGIDVSAVLKQI